MEIQRFDFRDLSSGDHIKVGSAKLPFRKSLKEKDKAPAPVEVAPPPPPPPTFSEAELRKVEQAAYQRGVEEGRKEGKKEADDEQAALQRTLLEQLEGYVKTVAPLFAEYRKMMVDVRAQMPQVALAMAHKVADAALDSNAKDVIEKLAAAACETMLSEPKLTITVHESMGDTLARQLELLTSRVQAATDIVILRDPNMPPADFRIEWKHGAMERNTSQIWEQIERAAGNMVASETRDANARLDQLQAELPTPEQPLDSKE